MFFQAAAFRGGAFRDRDQAVEDLLAHHADHRTVRARSERDGVLSDMIVPAMVLISRSLIEQSCSSKKSLQNENKSSGYTLLA